MGRVLGVVSLVFVVGCDEPYRPTAPSPLATTPPSVGDIHSQLERFDVGILEQRADALREVLRAQGWLEVPPTPDTPL